MKNLPRAKVWSFTKKKSSMKCGMLKDQCVPHICRDLYNIVKNKSKHDVGANQFVDILMKLLLITCQYKQCCA